MEASISSLSKLSLVEGKQLNTTWTASWGVLSLKAFYLGTEHVSKSDEFSEKFQTAFDPPPSFSESYIALFATKL